jgi:hypothetical protein
MLLCPYDMEPCQRPSCKTGGCERTAHPPLRVCWECGVVMTEHAAMYVCVECIRADANAPAEKGT